MTDEADATPMAPQTANALITGAPCNDEQLHAARLHFRSIETMLAISGPRFANARRDAAGLHNKAVQRLRESANEREARERRHREAASGLTELEVG